MKTALITGASSGIGKEFARRYAENGYRLILTARREDILEQLREELKTEIVVIPADLSDEKQCFELLKKLKDEDIDVFINNAGFGLAGSFLTTDVEREINMIKVNDIAMHIMFKGVLQKMDARGSGTILNVASSAGLFPGGPYMAGYYASKAYVVSLTRAVVQELKEKGSKVHVCALCPGPVDTDFNRNADVVFSLKGISASQCVSECLKEMNRKKTVIVPSVLMKAAVSLSKLVPAGLLTAMTGHQQKKKTGQI
ncbi:MAG: SDR family oxidoreductase [Erysipelotrichaceae bacterium]|nr:SDR family oxidoreductase [Erysipelotrichaceae bacterium]